MQLKVFLSFQSLALSRFSACICAPGCPCRSASETSTRNGKARVIWGSKPKEGGGGVYLFPSPRKSELKQQKYKGFIFLTSYRQYFYTLCVENMTESLHFVCLMRHMFCSVKCNHQASRSWRLLSR